MAPPGASSPPPTRQRVQFASLAGVSCTSGSACLATGGSDRGTLAERWNGTTWTHPAPPPTRRGARTSSSPAWPARHLRPVPHLASLRPAPVSTSRLRKGGTAAPGTSSQPQPSWQPTSVLPAVACPTLSACVTVAGYTNNGPNLTLAELWNRPNSGSQPATSHLAVRRGLALACTPSPLSIGGIRLAAQPRTAMAPVPGARPSQPDQSKATGHAGLVPANMKPIQPLKCKPQNQAHRRATTANRALPRQQRRSEPTLTDGTRQMAPEQLVLGRSTTANRPSTRSA